MELREFILPLRKWWWLAVAATLVATIASFLATRQQPAIYVSRTTLLVGSAIQNPNPTGYEFYLTSQLAATYVELAQRDTIKEAVMRELGLTWLPGYTARQLPNTQLLELAVTDTSPERAQAIAAELAAQLVKLSPGSGGQQNPERQAFVEQQLDQMEVSIQETQDEMSKKELELAGMFSARQISDTQSQIASLRNKLLTLQANYASLLANTERGALNTISVVEPAALPAAPIGPNKSATILLAAIIGLVLAAVAAYLLEYLDDTIKTPDEVQKQFQLITLGAIPTTEPREGSQEAGPLGRLEVLASGKSGASEAYRVLRANLQFASVDSPLRSIIITSPGPSEGKSATAANLSVVMAQAGLNVILVDADLRRPRQHRLFGLRNNIGLTTALVEGDANLVDLLQETAIPGLRLLASGPLPPNPSELLSSLRMRSVLRDLEPQASIVVIDSPPATMLSDATVLSAEADGVLLVVQFGGTRREAARRAVDGLRRVNARLMGAVLNRIPARRSGYYYYYHYYYYYSPGYGQEDDRRKGLLGLLGIPRRKTHHRRRHHSRQEQAAVSAPAVAPSPPIAEGAGDSGSAPAALQ